MLSLIFVSVCISCVHTTSVKGSSQSLFRIYIHLEEIISNLRCKLKYVFQADFLQESHDMNWHIGNYLSPLFSLCTTAQLPRENEAVNNTLSNNKKPRGRGLLRSLFCCFGRGRNGSSKSSKASSLQGEGRGSPPPGTGSPRFLLPPVRHQDMHKKCMVIDLDETLVHSSFKPINNADFVVPVEIDGTVHQVYVLKRPYVDEFLQRMGELYECVLFTASLAKVGL